MINDKCIKLHNYMMWFLLGYTVATVIQWVYLFHRLPHELGLDPSLEPLAGDFFNVWPVFFK